MFSKTHPGRPSKGFCHNRWPSTGGSKRWRCRPPRFSAQAGFPFNSTCTAKTSTQACDAKSRCKRQNSRHSQRGLPTAACRSPTSLQQDRLPQGMHAGVPAVAWAANAQPASSSHRACSQRRWRHQRAFRGGIVAETRDGNSPPRLSEKAGQRAGGGRAGETPEDSRSCPTKF